MHLNKESPVSESGAAGPKLATDHMVCYYRSVQEGRKFEFLVGCWNIASPTSEWLCHTIRGTTISWLANAGFRVLYITGDGAGENRGMFTAEATIPASDLIPGAIQGRYPHIDFSWKVAFRHPHNKEWLVWVIPDWPHVVKRLVNAMDASGKPKKKRDMRKDGKPIQLKMLKDVWIAAGGNQVSQLRVSKFKLDHFVKNNFNCMQVPLATQVCSGTMHHLICDVCAKGIAPLQDVTQYDSIKDFILRVDLFVDIMNGKKGHGKIRTSRDTDIYELLGMLDWFSEWSDVAPDIEFITRECFEDLRWIILGIASSSMNLQCDGGVLHGKAICLQAINQGKLCSFSILCYVHDGAKLFGGHAGEVPLHGQLTVPVICAPVMLPSSTDNCEHHFSNFRGGFGSGSNRSANEGLQCASLSLVARTSTGGQGYRSAAQERGNSRGNLDPRIGVLGEHGEFRERDEQHERRDRVCGQY